MLLIGNKHLQLMITYSLYSSPIGHLRLRADKNSLLAVDHVNQQKTLDPHWQKDERHPVLTQAAVELSEYFAKERTTFDVPLLPIGTDFQRQVWNALQTIPYGESRSYSDIANAINNPKAVRAVGLANGRNPLSIFIPCHRVIGKNGTLTGYAGGLSAKTTLLELERTGELF